MAARRMTVLVVDDDAKFRACMSSLLASGSMDAIEAGDANEAIIAARSHRPDAAILDVALPGVSGYGLCRELRDIYGPDLPVLFVSGSRTDPIDRAAGMLVGGDDYLVKPVDPDEVQVLQLIAEGLPPNEVARRLVISPKTVSSHVQRILTKLDVHTRAQAVAVAYEAGLIRVSPNEVEAHLAALSL
jgi:DNA-binding NarL/FixJ family response regulator